MIDSPVPHDDGQEDRDPRPATTARERDRYSTWSIVFLILIVASQLASSAGYEFSWKRSLKLTHEKASSAISSDALSSMTQIDIEAKTAYFQDSVTPGLSAAGIPGAIGAGSPKTVGKPKQQTLAEKLKPTTAAAVDLLRRNPDDPSIARRVILLRAESGLNPFDPIPATPQHRGLPDPLQTFAHAEAGSSVTAPIYRREVKLWSDLFSRRVTEPSQIKNLARAINTAPNLRWYKYLALHQLYSRAGESAPAQAALRRGGDQAGLSVGAIGLLTLFVLAAILLGLVVIIGVISRQFEKRAPGQPQPPSDSDIFGAFANPLPPPIANGERRLRPRDLMDCFVIFLIMLNVVSLAVSFAALAILRPHLKALSPLEVNYANILVTAVGYLGGGGAALWALTARARAVGASLAAELGLNRVSLAANIGFGLAGWGIALMLVAVISRVAGTALRAAPAPSNPALPLLISAPDAFTQVLLYGLVAIAAPFFEELFFRGALMNALLPRFGPIVSIGLTGLFFGLVHPVGIAEVFSLATLGMVMAWAAYTRKSLVPSMTMHFLQNSFSYFTLYFTFLTIAHR